MSTRIRVIHKEKIGSTEIEYRADINDTLYSDPVQEEVLQNNFFDWDYPKIDERNPFETPLQKSSLSVDLNLNETDDTAIITDIIDAQEERFTIDFYIDGTHEWSGVILTDLLEYPEAPFPFSVTITAKDLSVLESKDAPLNDSILANRTRLIEIIADCLLETGFSLSIRSYSNITNTEFDLPDEEYLFNVWHVDHAFRNDRGEWMSCTEVLKNICIAYNLIIYQSGGRWVIDQLPAVAKGDATQWDYDSAGANPVSSTPDRTVTIDKVDSFMLPRTSNIITGALKRAESPYQHRTLINNIQTADVDYIGDPSSVDIQNDGTFSLSFEQVDALFSFSGETTVQAVLDNDVPGGSIIEAYFEVIRGSDEFYMDDTGSWSSSSQQITVTLSGSINLPSNVAEGYFNIEQSTSFGDQGIIKVRFLGAEMVDDSGSGTDVTETHWFDTNFFIYNTGLQVRDNEAEVTYQYTRQGNYSVEVETESTILGEGPTRQSVGAATRSSTGSSSVLTDKTWVIEGESGGVSLEHLRLRERLSMQRHPLKNLRVVLWSKFRREQIISYRGDLWYFLGGRFSGKGSRWNGNALRLTYERDDTNDTFQSFVDSGGSPSGTSGTGSSSGGGGGGTNDHGALDNLDIPSHHPWALQTDFSNVSDWTVPDSRFLNAADNLSDLSNIATARSNLDVYSTGEADNTFLEEANNLSDLTNITTAQDNLGLTDGSADLFFQRLEIDVNSASSVEDILLSANANISGNNSIYHLLDTPSGTSFAWGTGSTVRDGSETILMSLSDAGVLQLSGNTVWHDGNVTGGTNIAISSRTINVSPQGAGSGLDADLWDGNEFSDYIDQPVRTTDSPTWAGGSFNGVTNFNGHMNVDIVGNNFRFNSDTSSRVWGQWFQGGTQIWQGRLQSDGSIQFIDIEGGNIFDIQAPLNVSSKISGGSWLELGGGSRISVSDILTDANVNFAVQDSTNNNSSSLTFLTEASSFSNNGGGLFNFGYGDTVQSGSETYILTMDDSGIDAQIPVTMHDTVAWTTPTFNTGFLGNGSRVYEEASEYHFETDVGFFRSALFANEFIINQILATQGSRIAGPGRGKIETVVDPTSGSEVVEVSDPEGNQYAAFAENDLILCLQVRNDLDIGTTNVLTDSGGVIVKRYVRRVTNVTGNDVTFTTPADAPSDAAGPAQGDVIVAFGNTTDTTRQNLLYETVIEPNAPYTALKTGIDSWTAYKAAGNLQMKYGNLNQSYGYTSDTFGMAVGPPSGDHATFDPTNGVRFIDGSGTVGAQFNSSVLTLGTGSNFVEFDVSAGTGYIKLDTFDLRAGDLQVQSTLPVMRVGTGTQSQVGLAGITSGSDIAFWAGDNYLDRGIAPVRIHGDGAFHFGGSSTNFIDWDGSLLSANLDSIFIETGGTGFESADFYLNSTSHQLSLGNVFSADGSAVTGSLAGWGFTDTYIRKQYNTVDSEYIGMGSETTGNQSTLGFFLYRFTSALSGPDDIKTIRMGQVSDLNDANSFTNDAHGIQVVTGTNPYTDIFRVDDQGNRIFAGFSFNATEFQSTNNTGFGTSGIYMDSAGERISVGSIFSANGATDTGSLADWDVLTTAIRKNDIDINSAVGAIRVGYGSSLQAGLNSSSNSGDTAIWAGETWSNRAVADFRVTYGGVLNATGATIEGHIDALTGSLGDLDVTGTLSVLGGNVIMGADIYTSASAGDRDGMLFGDDTMLVSEHGIDFDASSGTGREIEWHDLAHEDDLNSNSNLVGEIYATRVDATNSTMTIRAQSSFGVSEINLTSTQVNCNARLNMNDELLAEGATFSAGNQVRMLGHTRYALSGGSTGRLTLPRYSDSDRPASPDLGEVIYNTTINRSEVWNGSTWADMSQ